MPPTEHKGLVLGLDLGTNSIGWALVDATFDDDGHRVAENRLVAAGVRVFPAGVRQDKGGEKPLGQERRLHRSQRRRIARHRGRRRQLLRVLQDAGLLPTDTADLRRVMAMDPWELRARGLDHPLQPWELGRALYHLNQRRGFLSNRKSQRDRKEEGVVLESIHRLSSEMQEDGARTLGEFLWRLRERDPRALLRGDLRLRGRYISRQMVRQEFEALVAAQAPHHQPLSDPDTVEQIRQAIFFQRPFELTEDRLQQLPPRANAWRSPQVARCPLEPDEKRCPLDEPIAQRFRLLKEVNNLRIVHPDGTVRSLSPDERERLVAELSLRKDLTFSRARTLLGLSDYDRFNLEIGGRSKLLGDEIEAKFASTFGKRRWQQFPEDEKARIRNAVLRLEDPDELRHLLDSYDLPGSKVDSLLQWSPPEGYLRFSRKALERIVPHLEQGADEYTAIQREYPERFSLERRSKLPPLLETDKFFPITNPVVRRALTEVRKVVNAILREYGLPREIVIELARDLKRNSKQRKDYQAVLKKREKIREEGRKTILGLGISHPSRRDIDRYVLWKEQGETCPYTGRHIPLERLFSEEGGIDIDHILPFSLSLDDSLANKVVCYAEANREKGQRTPRQWLGDTDRYQDLLARVEDMCRKHGMPWSKYHRFLQEELDSDFLNRQLSDTQYITKEVIRYLELLYPDERRGNVQARAVRTTKGGITALLRHSWGLDGILDENTQDQSAKTRDDHRHHAVDAVVIALTTPRRLQLFSRALQGRSRPEALDQPWDRFRESVISVIRGITVSHRPTRRLSGAFHEATYYGPVRGSEGNRGGDTYVSRVPLESIGKQQVKYIVDPAIRALVQQRLEQHDNDPKKAFQEPLRMKSGVAIRRVRVYKKIPGARPLPLPDAHGDSRFVKEGNNHHIAFYFPPEGSNLKPVAEVVSVWEATRRAHNREPIVRQELPDGRRLGTYLCKGDMVLLRKDEGDTEELYVVRGISTGTPSQAFDLKLAHSTEANSSPGSLLRFVSFGAWLKRNPQKVEVDPLGRLTPVPY